MCVLKCFPDFPACFVPTPAEDTQLHYLQQLSSLVSMVTGNTTSMPHHCAPPWGRPGLAECTCDEMKDGGRSGWALALKMRERRNESNVLPVRVLSHWRGLGGFQSSLTLWWFSCGLENGCENRDLLPWQKCNQGVRLFCITTKSTSMTSLVYDLCPPRPVVSALLLFSVFPCNCNFSFSLTYHCSFSVGWRISHILCQS